MENGVLLSKFAQQLRRENAYILDIYFVLLDATGISPTPVLNQNAKAKEKRLSTEGGGAFGSVRNLVKASNL